MIRGITWTHIQSVWNHSGPLFRKPVTGQELFFAVSYSKPALGCGQPAVRTEMQDQPTRSTKGQLISNCPFGVTKSTKKCKRVKIKSSNYWYKVFFI